MAAEVEVKVGADIKDLLSKVDQAKAKLNQLTEEQGRLKASVNDLNSSLKQNEAELTKTGSALRKLVDSGKGATVEAKKLRAEMAGLATNTKQLNTDLAGAKNQLAATTVQLKAQTIAVKQAETATGGFSKGATKAFSALRSLANIIPGIGIGGLVALISGPVIEAFQEWYAATNKVSEATKLLQANQANLNDIMKDANKDAGKQIADLTILYQAATNVNLSTKDRLAAVNALQVAFPEYFANISKETILNGGAEEQYKALSKSIYQTAQAKAALNKLQELAGRQLDNDTKRQKILNANERERAKIIKDEAENNKRNAEFLKSHPLEAASRRSGIESILEVTNKRKEAGLKLLDANDKILKDEISFITKLAGIGQLAAVVESTIKPLKIPKEPKEKVVKAAKEEAIVYTETLQHAINELLKDGILPDDFGKAAKKRIDLTGSIIVPTAEIQAAGAALNAAQEKLDRMAGFVQDTLSPVFDTLFSSIADGSTNAFQAFGNALKSIITQLAATVAKAAALAAIMAFIFPTSKIGAQGFGALFNKFLGFAEGGEVKGRGSKTSDSIPARLSKGEYVIKAASVDKFGVRFFDQLNQGKAPNFFNGIPKFAQGGFIGNNLVNLGNIGGGQAIQIVGEFKLRNDHLVAAVRRGNSQINRNS